MNGPAVEPEWFGSVARFVHGLRFAREQAGVGERELARRVAAMGWVLPDRGRLVPWELPAEATVVALTRACGYGEELVARWVAVRRRLAAAPVAEVWSWWERAGYVTTHQDVGHWSLPRRVVYGVRVALAVVVGC